jgi:isoquinoline 1-oxidoreductase beta subunit
MRTASILPRRAFLLSCVELSGAWLLSAALPTRADEQSRGKPLPVEAFVRVRPDNRTVIVIPAAEMGQGVSTALAMIVADEMDLDWSLVDVEPAPLGPAYVNPLLGEQETGGSMTVRAFWKPLAVVGATAREMLVSSAAARWGMDASELQTQNSRVIHPGTGRALTYGDLASDAAARPVPSRPRVKKPSEYRLIGQPLCRLDAHEKVRGGAVYGIDVRLPGMLTAALVLPPVHQAPLLECDDAGVRGLPGIVAVERFSAGVAVLAYDFWTARKACATLAKTCRWGPSPMQALDSPVHVRAMRAALQGEARQHDPTGDAAAALAAATRQHEAIYEVPYLAHACMEPMNATAWVRPDRVEVWAPSQAQTAHARIAAKLTGLAPEQVDFHTTQLGGGFGRRYAPDFIAYAVELSMKARAPVKVIMAREDDFRAHYYRPAHCTRLRAGIGADGRISAYEARIVCASVFEAAGYPLSDRGVDYGAIEGLAENVYQIPNFQVEWVRLEEAPSVWWLRSTGHSPNAFAQESFIDELATLAHSDPVRFRLRHLEGDGRARHRAVLERAAALTDWGARSPRGTARGIAFHDYRGTIVATVAEVSLAQGAIRVHRIVTVVDAGRIVNPSGAAAMVEGGTIHGIGQALMWEITFRAGQVEQGNFDSYPLPRMDQSPVIHVDLMPSDADPTGLGEAAVPTVAPAIANALARMTGKRRRRLPLRATAEAMT